MTTLLPGTEVQARGLRWEVVDAQALGPQVLYRLRGREGASTGRELDLLHPFEQIEPVIHDLRPDRAAPLRNWLVYHQAFLLEQALGPDALLVAQPGRLRIEPYQLVPVLRAIRMSRVRLLLADGVGLGKTIQAGLVLTELIARRLAHRILIVTPAGPLLDQWKTEMSERFGLRLDVIDRARLEEIRRSTELGANPFDHIPLGLTSIDFLKQERVLDMLERASYDAVVIDEAHHCAEVGAAGDREDSLRRRLAEVLARRCDALLLLTATPHDGNDRSFASLCELLDPSLVDGRGVLRGDRYRPHVVRRLKRHVVDPVTGAPRFKDRIVEPRPVTASPSKHPAFVALQRALLDLLAPELRRAFRARRYSDVLAFLALLKRSVSTVEACRDTLAVVASRFHQSLTAGAEDQEARRERLRTLREYHRRLERFGTVGLEEERQQEILEAEDLGQQLAEIERQVRAGSRTLTRVSSVVEALDELGGLAEEALDHDPKPEQLAEEIAAIRQTAPESNVLVYTEYTSSQRALVRALRRAGLGQVLTMSGDDDDRTRGAITERFRTCDGVVLVSTDAAAEGLNLHARCHQLLHLELPFNPNRLEQRNGRIDRYGQTHNPVVRYLFLRGTFEERILLRLIAKYERQRARLTFVPNTLGLTASSEETQGRLLRGLMEDDARLFHEEGTLFDFVSTPEEEGADEPTRELLEEIDRSLRGFERAARSNAWLSESGLNAEATLAAEADQALLVGARAGMVDLARFVCDAVQLDGGEVRERSGATALEVRLPPAWCHGLDEVPGYDADSRTARLTTDLEVNRDEHDRSVGYLGRAHPLVRRALDRVRHLSFGGAAHAGLDPRVSAVEADVSEPTVLFTFLGRLSSRSGRELERVLAASVTATGVPTLHDTPAQWSPLADPARAIRTTEVWSQHFASWWQNAAERARQCAEAGFAPVAGGFACEWRTLIADERARQYEWLGERAGEIVGAVAMTPAQPGLFDQASQEPAANDARPAWSAATEPGERLAGFAADRTQSPARRGEAESVLRIHRQRLGALDARLALGELELLPLGALMLVPRGA
jgi:superfamily II DNA or RNA helicase